MWRWRSSRRPLAETMLAVVLGVNAVAVALWPEWTPAVFRVDPDRGNGSLEVWLFVLSTVAFLLCASLAARGWRRATMAAG